MNRNYGPQDMLEQFVEINNGALVNRAVSEAGNG